SFHSQERSGWQRPSPLGRRSQCSFSEQALSLLQTHSPMSRSQTQSGLPLSSTHCSSLTQRDWSLVVSLQPKAAIERRKSRGMSDRKGCSYRGTTVYIMWSEKDVYSKKFRMLS